MAHEGTRARPPRQRLTLEITVLLTTLMVVIGVWTRSVVLAEPTPTASVPAAVRTAAPTLHHRVTHHPHREIAGNRRGNGPG
jgi:hypothetical protein